MRIEGPLVGDAFGAAFLAQLEQDEDAGCILVERDDGLITCDPVHHYFNGWSDLEAASRSHFGHRVLDAGAGAGRHSLDLQGRGHDVIALDPSPGAIEVCSRRGIRQTHLGTIADLVATSPRPFDTILLFGNGLGLLGSPEAAGSFMANLEQLCAPGALVIGTMHDPYQTKNPLHSAYHRRNRDQGRMAGQLRLRMRWRNLASDWFDLLLLSQKELTSLTASHDWLIVDRTVDGPDYLAVLRPPPR